jgi:hypothetical protein
VSRASTTWFPVFRTVSALTAQSGRASKSVQDKPELTVDQLRRVLLRMCRIMNGPSAQCAEPCARCSTASVLFTVIDPPRFLRIAGVGTVDFGEPDVPTRRRGQSGVSSITRSLKW